MKQNVAGPAPEERSIVVAGAAGQGVQSIEAILASAATRAGYHVFTSKEFMSRIRGGINSVEIRISLRPVRAFVERIDLLCALVPGSLAHLAGRVSPATLVIGDSAVIGEEARADAPFASIAAELGNPLYAGTVAAGAIAGILGLEEAACLASAAAAFEGKAEGIITGNRQAMLRGLALGAGLRNGFIPLPAPPAAAGRRALLSGAEAIAMGAVAGGCDYVCAYPMSPSTSVLELMASYSRSLDILVEQVEDEIGVVNMAVGAAYAGARPLVTTSGGGFALMGEGISLAGMTELPLVIHLAQRPGPATGLPTRTEQGDLFLALHSGHGDFARILLAPGDVEAGYRLSMEAQELAHRWQAPVIVLTDQYFVDSYYDIEAFALPALWPPPSRTVEAVEGYRRYAIAGSEAEGLSPRAIPGSGKGRVRADSDEHDEDGFITESQETRRAMVAKRLRKLEAIRLEAPRPRLYGRSDAEVLVVAWGSTKGAALEAVSRVGEERAALLHFEWLWPLPKGFEEPLRKAKRVLLAENNATGQLGELIRMESGFPIEGRILKSSGFPLSAEEIEAGILEALEGKENHG